MTLKPDVEAFFDEATSTLSYIVIDTVSSKCAIIDAVLDYDPASGKVSYQSADKLIDYVQKRKLEVVWILDTHPHADHLSAMDYLLDTYGSAGAKTAIGQGITKVQALWSDKFNFEDEFKADGSQFNCLLDPKETFKLGNLECEVIATPGHTPSCCTFRIGDALFVGDTLFMPDGGSARADFPGGDARTLYRSIQTILSFPEEMRIFVCHDYQPGGRAMEYETTVGAQKADNIHVGGGKSEEEFVELRTQRDKTLGAPRLLYPSLQVNIRAGRLNPVESNGQIYMKTPVTKS